GPSARPACQKGSPARALAGRPSFSHISTTMSVGWQAAWAEGTIRRSRISVTPLRCFGITFLNQDGVTRPRGWFELDMETRSKLLDVSKAELRFNGKSLKLII